MFLTIIDYSKQIKALCYDLVRQGYDYEWVSDEQICYVSDKVVIMINYDRYNDSFSMHYAFANDLDPDSCFPLDKAYNVAWSIAKTADRDFAATWLQPKPNNIEQLGLLIECFIQHPDFFLTRDTANELLRSYAMPVLTVEPFEDINVILYANNGLSANTYPKHWQNIAGYRQGELLWFIHGMQRYKCWQYKGFKRLDYQVHTKTLVATDIIGHQYSLDAHSGEATLQQYVLWNKQFR